MVLKFKVEAIHQGEPAKVDVEIEFDKGEYVEVPKQMPTVMAQMNTMFKMKKGK